MTLNKNFSRQKTFENQVKNTRQLNQEYNYVDSYMKNNKFTNYDKNYNELRDNQYTAGKYSGKNNIKIDKKNQMFGYDAKTFNPNFGYSPQSAKTIQNHFSFNFNDAYSQMSPLKLDIERELAVNYRYYQELKDSKKFKNKLEQFDIMPYFNDYDKFEQSKQFVLEDKNLNLNRLIENVKKYFAEESIPYILNYHFENFDNINKIFIDTLKIRLMAHIQDDINNKYFEEEMHKAFHDSYLNFPTDHFYNAFSNTQAIYEQNEKNFHASDRDRVLSNPEYNKLFGQNIFGMKNDLRDNREYKTRNYEKNIIKFKIFFGDRTKIGILIDIIESKLMSLMKNRLQQASQINANKYESKITIKNRIF
jgi:hypothetical protein